MPELSGRVRLGWFISAFFVILSVGTVGFMTSAGHLLVGGWPPVRFPTWLEFFDALYAAVQLFVLEFNPADGSRPDVLLQIARFAAALYSAWTVLSLLIQPLRLAFQQMLSRRIVVVGYGRLGQLVAQGLRQQKATPAARRSRGFAITAVHGILEREMRDHADRHNVLLLQEDPFSGRMHDRIGASGAERIFVALDSDQRTLDAAGIAKDAVAGKGVAVAAVLEGHAAPGAHGLASTTSSLAGIRVITAPASAAQLLAAEARFDRTALEAGHKRVHLVICGCGVYGEAVVYETLLTAWRVSLDPPRLTILDRDIEPVKASLKLRSPAFFVEAGEPGSLPAEARPQIRMLAADSLHFDDGRWVETMVGDHTAVTAWVFAANDDDANHRGATALYEAMQNRSIAVAPIRLRKLSLPAVAPPPRVTNMRSFGAIGDALAGAADPDAAAKAIHARYMETGERMSRASLDFKFSDVQWSELTETKKESNRRFVRHTLMKIEDLGLQSRARPGEMPVVISAFRDLFAGTEDKLEYSALSEARSDLWWRKAAGNVAHSADEAAIAGRIRDVAIVEHNRWIADRAVDGWRPSSKRDDERRLHPSMKPWAELDAPTKRWDAVLTRALVEGNSGARHEISEPGGFLGRLRNLSRSVEANTWPARRASLVLKLGQQTGGEPAVQWKGRDPALADGVTTQIDLVIAGAVGAAQANRAAERARMSVEALLGETGVSDRLCRLRFVFRSPPGAAELLVANAIADAAAEQDIEVSSSWLWSKSDAAVGFAGHRDLARLGGADGLGEHLESLFVSLIADGRAGRLISGYAPGADRIAVERWNALNLSRPELVFPYVDPSTGEFLTDEPAEAGPDERLAIKDAEKIGKPRLAAPRTDGEAHSAQALDIIENCGVLVAVYDGNGNSGVGSVGDTIAQARARGLNVIEVTRGKDGAFRNQESRP